MKRVPWFAALACVAAVSAAPASDYVRVQFLPAKEPALFLQFDEDTLRIAAAPEGLAAAQPVKAQHVEAGGGQGVPTVVNYAHVPLPALPPGATSAAATFFMMRFTPGEGAPEGLTRMTFISGSFSISMTGTAGAVWTYVPSADVSIPGDAAAPSPRSAPVMMIGDLSHPVLTIEPEVKGRQVGLGLRLWTAAPGKAKEAGGRERFVPRGAATAIESLRKNGKPARVHLDVIASPGKTIKSADGDLDKFGFG